MSGNAELTATRHWWGECLHALLEETGASGARAVQRGQALARRGVVEDLAIGRGSIAGTVMEDRVAPVEVAIDWPTTDDAGWQRAAAALGQRLRPIAALMEGGLRPFLVEELADVGIALLPSLEDLGVRCSCESREPWCRHATAVYTVAATRIDRNPMLLLELRGRSQEQLLAALRGPGPVEAPAEVPDAATVGGDLDAIPLHPSPVQHPEHLLRQLGSPPGVDDPTDLEDLVARAAATAWQLAAGEGAEAADEAALLTELRSQRVATVASLAAVLGWPAETVARGLEALFGRGEVLRTGAGERTRYRASSG